MIPVHLKYTHTHEWFLIDNKAITVGLTRFIMDKLDRLLFLDLPKVGDEILSGISFGEVESLDMLVDVTSPLSGEVISVNERLYENLGVLSEDPYNHGWLIKFVSTEKHLLNELMNAEEYATHIAKLQSSVTPLKRRKRRGKPIIKGRRRRR